MAVQLVSKSGKSMELILKEVKQSNVTFVDKILNAMANETQSNAIQLIQGGSRSGKTYKRGGKEHIASSAGEPPKTDKGNLVANIIAEPRGRLLYVAGSNKKAPYGLYLELGTRNISPRPWLQPSFEKVYNKFKRLLK